MRLGRSRGRQQIIAELAEHARLLAQRFGDRVDEWGTLNEPMNYLLASYGVGQFPPGRVLLLSDFDTLVSGRAQLPARPRRDLRRDQGSRQIDADGDGVAAQVGLTLNVVEWLPSHNNAPSDAAGGHRRGRSHRLRLPPPRSRRVAAAAASTPTSTACRDESHPDWTGKLDWLGVQYYSRQGVSAEPPVIPVLNLMVCFGDFDLGTCVPPADPTHWVPAMGYEYYEPGIYNVLTDFARR